MDLPILLLILSLLLSTALEVHLIWEKKHTGVIG